MGYTVDLARRVAEYNWPERIRTEETHYGDAHCVGDCVYVFLGLFISASHSHLGGLPIRFPLLLMD